MIRGGRTPAANLAIRETTGDIVIMLDDDDLFFADHVECLVSGLLSDDKVSAAYSYAWDVATMYDRENGKYFEKNHELKEYFKREYSNERLMTENFIPIQAIATWRRDLIDIVSFREDIEILEDWNLWVRVAELGPFVCLPKLTSLYRTPVLASERARRQQTLDVNYMSVYEKNIEDIIEMKYKNLN